MEATIRSHRKMWTFTLVSLLIFHSSSSTLSGDNVCQEKETFKLNVTHYMLRNITVRSYVWCYRFPPRCTTFSIKQVNDSEIKEEDGVRFKNVCCTGYVPNEDGNSCVAVSRCTVNCINGICDEDSKCYCNPGYRGDDCSKACIENRWGRYCRYHCNCVRGTCDSATGHCSCPAGWSGNSCRDLCPTGRYGLNCTSTCNCHSNECDPIDGQCMYNPSNQVSKHKNTSNIDNGLRRLVEDTSRKLPRNDSVRIPVLQKYHTFNVKVINDSTSKLIDMKTTTEAAFKFKQETNYNRSSSPAMEISSSQGSTENPSLYLQARDNFVLTLQRESSDAQPNSVKDNVTEGTPKLLRMKVLKSYDEDDGDITSINNMQPREEAYLDDGEIHKNMSTRSGSLFFTIGAIAVLSLLLIGILSLVLALRRFKRISPTDIDANDRDGNALKCTNGTMMTVTARSIFHTPLPDPPIINNPIFTTPVENSSTFETHVICSVNILNKSPLCQETADSTEIFYDHPPSTGSYRAVALPEPPDKGRSLPLANGEPVYDEIPCWKLADVDCNQIYQNDSAGIYVNSINRKSNQYK